MARENLRVSESMPKSARTCLFKATALYTEFAARNRARRRLGCEKRDRSNEARTTGVLTWCSHRLRTRTVTDGSLSSSLFHLGRDVVLGLRMAVWSGVGINRFALKWEIHIKYIRIRECGSCRCRPTSLMSEMNLILPCRTAVRVGRGEEIIESVIVRRVTLPNGVRVSESRRLVD